MKDPRDMTDREIVLELLRHNPLGGYTVAAVKCHRAGYEEAIRRHRADEADFARITRDQETVARYAIVSAYLNNQTEEGWQELRMAIGIPPLVAALRAIALGRTNGQIARGETEADIARAALAALRESV